MVYAVLSILYNLIMILPVLAIKNMILKIIGIVIMSILIIWWIYMNLYRNKKPTDFKPQSPSQSVS